jgi:hypothetical protein
VPDPRYGDTPVTAVNLQGMSDSSTEDKRKIVQANSLRSVQERAGKRHLAAETRQALA